MNRFALALALVLAAVAGRDSVVTAQPAAALGKPLPDANLPGGTVVVRVIAGDPSAAAAGIDVQLVVNGTARTARTSADGRATFGGIPGGATVQAKVAGESGEITTEAFAVPAAGGVRVMLSTKPMVGGNAMGTGPQGMPAPRQMSGQARPQQGDSPGRLTVRLTYDDWNDPQPPANHPVVLVGYKDDGTVGVTRATTDASGRAMFDDLDVSGRTAYYAMTLLARNNRLDRLISEPVQMLPGVGMRLALSSEQRSSTEPALDDIAKLATQIPNVEPGVVAVAVLAEAKDDGGTAELVDATTGKVIASERIGPASDPGRASTGRFGPFEPEPDVPAGTLRVIAIGGPDGNPLVGAAVALVPAEATMQAPPPTQTDSRGLATFTGVAAGTWKVQLANASAKAESDPVQVPADQGGRVVGALTWFEGIPPRIVRISGAPATGEPVYVQLKIKGDRRRSLPFQPLADRGTTTPFGLGPPLRFQMLLDGSVDDKYIGFQGTFVVINTDWAPYRATPDGTLFKMPAGFVGGVVGDDDKQLVSPEDYQGFRIRRPLPPGPLQFRAGFSLPIDGGVATWSLDLPWGTEQSRIAILDSPGMKVELPAGAEGKPVESKAGIKFFLIDGIEIEPGHNMAMRITGLPSPAAWKVWVPRFAGLAVFALLVGTIVVVLRIRRASREDAAGQNRARIKTLMDELVELEKRGQGGGRREAILGELEQLWETDRKAAG